MASLEEYRGFEIGWSGSGNPPGKTGMATTCSTIWFRCPGGEWIQIHERSWSNARSFIDGVCAGLKLARELGKKV